MKVTLEAQLGLIRGTMGLLTTGFSILSGVEIVYFLIRLDISLAFFRDIGQNTLLSCNNYVSIERRYGLNSN